MTHISTTLPGRRPVDAGQLSGDGPGLPPAPQDAPDKWSIFRDLTTARKAFGVSDRDLTVLSALLSFHLLDHLDDDENTIVFPSNAKLSARAHGMAESTLRRHLAALVQAGLIRRHDSPNGKRYARRNCSGALDVAYGFDLRPLITRAQEIGQAATAARETALRHKRLRETIVLHLRDAVRQLAYTPGDKSDLVTELQAEAAALKNRLRRKLDPKVLEELNEDARKLLDAVTNALENCESPEMSGNARHSERHIQDSKQITNDLESVENTEGEDCLNIDTPDLPLGLVLESCPELQTYALEEIRCWHGFLKAAEFVRPMLGVTYDAWRAAQHGMGPQSAAIVLACILQRMSVIRSPGGYLRALTAKAEINQFSPGPMVMALFNSAKERMA
ncbi:plasmid replication protein RepC [Amaricoccus macauensis]|uniref:plasmid replication protein RepC n=1 Tax=Amaricoccus macauensis TaxID=57001 RepID=UPI003C7E7ECC